MSKAAVVIDSWKLEIFEKHLKEAGYTYKILSGLSQNSLTLQVDYEWVAKLQPIIEAAQEECAKNKPKKLET